MQLKILFTFCVSAFFISPGCSSKKIVKVEEKHIIINSNEIDSSIFLTIAPYKKSMDGEMNEVVGKTSGPFIKETPEGTLGNLVADCVFARTKKSLGKDSLKLSMVILNNGGLRTSLPQGDITVGKLFELMPFDNEIVVVEITGTKMLELGNYLAEKGGMPVAGCKLNILNNKVSSFKIKGTEIDTSQSYFVISSDYLANGGDKMIFFKNPKSIFNTKLLIRNELIAYFKEQTSLKKIFNPSIDGRISVAK